MNALYNELFKGETEVDDGEEADYDCAVTEILEIAKRDLLVSSKHKMNIM